MPRSWGRQTVQGGRSLRWLLSVCHSRYDSQAGPTSPPGVCMYTLLHTCMRQESRTQTNDVLYIGGAYL